MADDIGPGDVVEALRSVKGRSGNAVEVGKLYTVAGFMPTVGACGACKARPFVGVALVGFHVVRSPYGVPWSFCTCLFRPISRRADFARTLEALKQPAPARVLEPARAK